MQTQSQEKTFLHCGQKRKLQPYLNEDTIAIKKQNTGEVESKGQIN